MDPHLSRKWAGISLRLGNMRGRDLPGVGLQSLAGVVLVRTRPLLLSPRYKSCMIDLKVHIVLLLI